MFRLPRGVLDEETAGLYCYTDAASLIEAADHLIVSLYADGDPDDYWEQPSDQFAAMVQARSELAAGDLRLLYLGWPPPEPPPTPGTSTSLLPGRRQPGRRPWC